MPLIGTLAWPMPTANPYQRHEDSIRYEGSGVAQMITDTLREMEELPLVG